MGFFKTKDPKTGEPRLGAGVYLIICGLMIGGVVLWNVTKDSNAGIPKENTSTVAKANQSSVAMIAEAAKNHNETLPELEQSSIARETASDREAVYQSGVEDEVVVEEDKSVDTVNDTFEILRQSQERAEREKAAAVARARAEAQAAAQAEIDRLRALAEANGTEVPEEVKTPARSSRRVRRSRRTTSSTPSARSVEASDEDPVIEVDSNALVVYDVNRDNPPQPTEVVQVQEPTGFDTGDFLPRGHIFPVYILSTVQSVGQEDIVSMAVAENVVFQNKIQIPFGTRLLGQGAAASFEDRIAINVDTILYPDGRELPISAFLKDPFDMASGVRGYYIPQPLKIQLVPYINEFMASWLSAVADRSRSNDNSDSGSSFNGRRDTIESSSNLIRTQASKIQSRLEARYPEKVVIPIGTKAYVQLRSPLDLTRARVAGSFYNTQPILPGFENNPIRPSGIIEQTANGKTNSAGVSSLGALGSMISLSNSTPKATTQPTPQARVPQNVPQTPTPTQQTKEMENYLNMLNKMSDSLDKKKAESSSSWMSGDL